MRRLIQAATCKSEEFNQFISGIRFGGGGVISDNMRPNQRKIIRFNHLVANMLIFHTVVYQTKAVNKLRGLRTEIPNEILSEISPYWTEHLNRFGLFQLDMQKMMAEIEYDLIGSAEHKVRGKTNWSKVKSMTEKQIISAAKSDPDARPLTRTQLKKFKRVNPPKEIDVQAIREKLHVSQKEFASYFGLSARTIQEWEQHRRTPTTVARNFLKVIDKAPKAVLKALAA